MKNQKPKIFKRETWIGRRWKGLLFGAKPCERCGGLLTRDEELGVSAGGKLPSLRCIQCGEWVDEITLLNRVKAKEQQAEVHRSPRLPARRIAERPWWDKGPDRMEL